MYQIDNPTAAATMPTPSAKGEEGYFTGGNSTTGQPATIVEADWLNNTMLELVNIVRRAGMQTSKTDATQLIQALSKLFTGDFTTATSTQQILVPAWASSVEFELSGGGGAGASAQSNGAGGFMYGAGGGSGAYLQGQRPVTPGTLLNYVHGGAGQPGGAGAGGGSGPQQSTAGGTGSLSFVADEGGWAVSCTGGDPGWWGSANSAPGGAGGVPSGGTVQGNGNYGSDGQSGANTRALGNGAPGFWGGAGRAGAGVGLPATGPGAGGGGAYITTDNQVFYWGGAGAAGLLKYRFLP